MSFNLGSNVKLDPPFPTFTGSVENIAEAKFFVLTKQTKIWCNPVI